MAENDQFLRNLIEKISKQLKYDNHNVILKQISSEGANYSGTIFAATISAPDKEDVELFVKIADLSELMRSKMPVERIFKVENYFYTDLLKEYAKMEEENNVPVQHKIKAAKYYANDDTLYQETIVLENLVAKGFTAYDRLKSVDWEYASKSIEELVKLHALSFAYAERNPDKFKELISEMKAVIHDASDKEYLKGSWRVMATNSINVVKKEHRDRLKRFVNEDLYDNNFNYYKPLKRPVLIHGDYRHSNLMHKRVDGNLEVVIIDYQTLQAGCPIMDLLYFIFNCSDEEFRRQYYEKLVEHYYTQLRLALQRLHVDPDKVYPREDFEYELKEMLPFGLSIGVFTLQIVTVEAANAPKLDGELSEFSVKTSDLFAERLNGIVNDYIRWGII